MTTPATPPPPVPGESFDDYQDRIGISTPRAYEAEPPRRESWAGWIV